MLSITYKNITDMFSVGLFFHWVPLVSTGGRGYRLRIRVAMAVFLRSSPTKHTVLCTHTVLHLHMKTQKIYTSGKKNTKKTSLCLRNISEFRYDDNKKYIPGLCFGFLYSKSSTTTTYFLHNVSGSYWRKQHPKSTNGFNSHMRCRRYLLVLEKCQQ